MTQKNSLKSCIKTGDITITIPKVEIKYSVRTLIEKPIYTNQTHIEENVQVTIPRTIQDKSKAAELIMEQLNIHLEPDILLDDSESIISNEVTGKTYKMDIDNIMEQLR